MPAPLKFLDRVSDIVARGPSLLSVARDLLLDSNDVRTGDVADILDSDPEAYRRHVETTIIGVANERLREPLTEALADHLAEVRAEYELEEGSEPQGAAANQSWQHGFYIAVCSAMESSDLDLVIQGEGLWGRPSAVADAVLSQPVKDPTPVLARLGVTPADVDKLVVELRAASLVRQREQEAEALFESEAEVLSGGTDLQPLVRLVTDFLAGGGDRGDASEATHYVLSGDPALLETALVMLEVFDDADAAALRAISESCVGRDTKLMLDQVAAMVAEIENTKVTSSSGNIFADLGVPNADDVLAGAEASALGSGTAEPFGYHDMTTRDEGVSAEKKRRRTPPSVPESPRTRAAQAAVEAMCDLTSMTEAQVAEALGVSRSVMSKIYRGQHALELDDKATARVRGVLHKFAKIADIFCDFEEAYR